MRIKTATIAPEIHIGLRSRDNKVRIGEDGVALMDYTPDGLLVFIEDQPVKLVPPAHVLVMDLDEDDDCRETPEPEPEPEPERKGKSKK